MKKTNIFKKFFILVLTEFGHLGATNLSGSSGGTTFSHNRGGSYARRRVIPVNPNTPAQASVRTAFTNFSQAWRALTQSQRDSWTGSTGSFTKHNRLGKVIHLSGINLYKSLNQNLFDIGITNIDTAPLPVGAPNVNSLSFVADSVGLTMVTTFAPTPTSTYVKTMVFASPQVSPGINFLKNRMVKIQVLAAATATGADVITAYTARFGALTAGQKIQLGFVAVNRSTGERSTMITAQAIVV